MKGIINLIVTVLLFASCSSSSNKSYIHSATGNNGKGSYKIGTPYKVFGKFYYPEENYSYSEIGIASWYGADFHEGITANGEKYDMNAMTAAHRTLPLPSIVKVTNLRNNKTAILRVNDRGPFVDNRIIDVSKKAAEVLGFKNMGITKVKVEIMPKESKALKASLTGVPITNDASGYDEEPEFNNAFVFKNEPVQEYNLIKINPEPATYDKGEFDESSTTDMKKTRRHFVQMGAFKDYENAVNLKKQILSERYITFKNNDVNIYPIMLNNQTLYRLRIGPYKDSVEALKIYNEIISSGYNSAKIISDK